MVTEERSREAQSVVDLVTGWAAERGDVRGVVVVGSWARGAARMDSDLDLVVLTDNPRYADADLWTGLLGGQVTRLAEWGPPLKEIRVRRPSGFEVEMGVVPVSWAHTEPVDAGTRRVIGDGHRVVHDPAGLLAALSAACAS
ncbi:nucleotidyltransferase domain-containing protein [Micromonospora sp. H33]|uniref:nucleotidyltransferase domain-containing protein n=1 Tax=Micromonospora sp. H33 TaxID=3452215 RepID=UPI003F8B917B